MGCKKIHKAFAALEYMMLIIVFVAALVSFQSYIKRAMSGQYRKAGESFAYGRQYSASATTECAYNDQVNVWYRVSCFNSRVVSACKTSGASCEQAVMRGCSSGCN